MNTISIIGNLTTRPELKTSGETKYTRFSIAVNSYSKGEKHVEFFDVVAFGKNAETICEYLPKGYTLALTGHLHQDVYTNKENKKVSSVCIYLDTFTLVHNSDKKKEDENSSDFKPFN